MGLYSYLLGRTLTRSAPQGSRLLAVLPHPLIKRRDRYFKARGRRVPPATSPHPRLACKHGFEGSYADIAALVMKRIRERERAGIAPDRLCTRD